jgi:hypothetical protein
MESTTWFLMANDRGRGYADKDNQDFFLFHGLVRTAVFCRAQNVVASAIKNCQ